MNTGPSAAATVFPSMMPRSVPASTFSSVISSVPPSSDTAWFPMARTTTSNRSPTCAAAGISAVTSTAAVSRKSSSSFVGMPERCFRISCCRYLRISSGQSVPPVPSSPTTSP